MYRDNRVKAWHVALNGELTDHISYLVKGSYREGMGTYNKPIYPKHHPSTPCYRAPIPKVLGRCRRHGLSIKVTSMVTAQRLT